MSTSLEYFLDCELNTCIESLNPPHTQIGAHSGPEEEHPARAIRSTPSPHQGGGPRGLEKWGRKYFPSKKGVKFLFPRAFGRAQRGTPPLPLHSGGGVTDLNKKGA